MTPSDSVPAETTAAMMQKDLQLLAFTLHGEEYAFDLVATREILPMQPLTEVPHAPKAVRGILNVRGKLATVIDLGVLLDVPAGEAPTQSYIILAERGKDVFGILVENVTGVVRTSHTDMKPAPDLLAAKAAATYMRGAIVIPSASAQRLLLVLDLPRLLDAVAAS